MEIQLDTLTADPTELDLSATAEELDLQLDLAAVQGPVSFRLSAWRIDDEIFLNGTVAYAIQYTCARCLGEFRSDCALPLHLVLQLVADESLAESDDESDEFVAVSAAKTEYVLDQHLRDLIALEVPMKPVCREDCRGLCPTCGINRNEATCNCQENRQDPRWDALRKLRNS